MTTRRNAITMILFAVGGFVLQPFAKFKKTERLVSAAPPVAEDYALIVHSSDRWIMRISTSGRMELNGVDPTEAARVFVDYFNENFRVTCDDCRKPARRIYRVEVPDNLSNAEAIEFIRNRRDYI